MFPTIIVVTKQGLSFLNSRVCSSKFQHFFSGICYLEKKMGMTEGKDEKYVATNGTL